MCINIIFPSKLIHKFQDARMKLQIVKYGITEETLFHFHSRGLSICFCTAQSGMENTMYLSFGSQKYRQGDK